MQRFLSLTVLGSRETSLPLRGSANGRYYKSLTVTTSSSQRPSEGMMHCLASQRQTPFSDHQLSTRGLSVLHYHP